MRRQVVVLALGLACLALAGCGELAKRKEAAEARSEAAAKRLDMSLRQMRELEGEAAPLRTKLAEATAKLSARRLELQRTLAAASYLKAGHPEDLAGWDTESASVAADLEAATTSKDAARLTRVVEEAIRKRQPCVEKRDDKTSDEEGEPACTSEPYPDACLGVAENEETSPSWVCDRPLLRNAGLPTVAVCRTEISQPAETDERSPYAEQGLPTKVTVLRSAFLYDGQIHLADFPEGDVNLYFPRRLEALRECRATNESNKCTHECDVSYGRWEDPCERKYVGSGCSGDDSGGDGDGEAEDLPYAVRYAQEEANRAAERAREAEEESSRAQQELGYQKCLAACSPPSTTSASAGKGEEGEEGADAATPRADRAEARLKLAQSPAPGILVVERDVVLFASDNPLEVSTSTLLLQDDGLAGLAEKADAGKPTLTGLRLLAQLQDSRAPGVARELGIKTLPAAGAAMAITKLSSTGPLLAGVTLDDGLPSGFVLSGKKGTPPAKPLERAALCEAVAQKPADFGEAKPGLAAACERWSAADAKETSLSTALGAVETAEGLKAWKADMDAASSLLLAPQRTALEAAFKERKEELAKAELERFRSQLKELEYKDAKDWKARVSSSGLLKEPDKRKLRDELGERAPALAKTQLSVLLAKVSVESGEALDGLKVEAEQSVVLTSWDKDKVLSAIKSRRDELQAADAGGGQ